MSNTFRLTHFNKPQLEFLRNPKKFKAFVGGYGSGKTFVGCSELAKHALEFPLVKSGYFAPSYSQIVKTFYPGIEEALEPWKLTAKFRLSSHEVDLYLRRVKYGTVICVSMERPEKIVGFKIGKAVIDEIDTLESGKALHAWRKIISRLRYKNSGSSVLEQLQNGASITTTPEGFRFVYKTFVQNIQQNPALSALYGITKASTYDNAKNLNRDYIRSLLETYPENLARAYLMGEFVNLTSGSVYSAYDRIANGSSQKVERFDDTLHIGMDFNVGKMSAITHVMRLGVPHAVDEITKALDTPDMIRKIKERYCNSGVSRKIFVYPDASGGSRKSVNASTSDIALLKSAGFIVRAKDSNPPVRDRVTSMNSRFCSVSGERRYFVNATACPEYADSLEKQVYSADGSPDKSGGFDHTNDAAGYYIYYVFPVKKASSRVIYG